MPTNHPPATRPGRDHGFTIMELMVVVIVIGILTSIAVPGFIKQRQKGVDASLRSDLKAAALAHETWLLSNPGYIGTQLPSDFVDAGFNASDGNVIYVSIHAGQGGYCLMGYNKAASDQYNHNIYALMGYDSTNGGLLPYPIARTTGGSPGIKPTSGSCGPGRNAVVIIS